VRTNTRPPRLATHPCKMPTTILFLFNLIDNFLCMNAFRSGPFGAILGEVRRTGFLPTH
jgi:hypothetical protein